MLTRVACIAALTGALALPAAANAGEWTMQAGGVLHYEAAAGQNDQFDSIVYDTVNSQVVFSKAPGGEQGFQESIPECGVNPAGTQMSCADTLFAGLDLELGSGDDTAIVHSLPADVDLTVDAGDGRDVIAGTPAADTLRGGPGSDSILGFGGDDTIDGGEGSDAMDGMDGADTITGGGGFDVARYDRLGASQPVTVTLDGVRNDGRVNERDLIGSGVDDVVGGAGDDVLIGDDDGNVLTGGEGNDKLDGGGGPDAYSGESGNDTITARDGLIERVDCGEGTDAATVDDIDSLDSCESAARSNELQSDLDGDRISTPTDCDDRNAAIKPGAVDVPDDGIDQNCDGRDSVDLDRDRDGSPRPADCDDTNAGVRPGASERRGNSVDEDCSGRADGFVLIISPVTNRWRPAGSATVVRELVVRDVPAGATVTLRCSGRGCPRGARLRRRTVSRATKRVVLTRHLRGARLRRGAQVEITISAPESIAKISRIKIGRPGSPRGSLFCQAPGQRTPRAC